MARVVDERQPIERSVRAWFAMLGGLTIGAITFTLAYPVRGIQGFDFQAFWCGGKALLAHANPYLNQPLHACEVASSPIFFTLYPNMTIPDPLPAYAIALLTPLSLMPFGVARIIWWSLLVLCAVLAGRGIAKLTGMAQLTAYAASAVAILAPALILGSLSPLPIALTILAAVALRSKKWTAAAGLLGFAMIEPHMVLPVCVAVAIVVRQMRMRLALVGLAALAVMVSAVGPQAALSYFTYDLPTHAAAEINSIGQNSLSAMLFHLGVPARLAITIGSLQYSMLALCAVFVSSRLYRKSGDLAWVVLVPGAFAVVGGAFIHLDEVAMAVPLACLIAMRRPGTAPTLALVLLAVPFESLVNWAPWALPAALACGWLLLRAGASSRSVILSGLVILFAVGAVVFVPGFVRPAGRATASAAAPMVNPQPNASASVAWADVNARYRIPMIWWPEKMLAFIPLAMLLWFSLVEAAVLPAAHRRRWIWTSCVL